VTEDILEPGSVLGVLGGGQLGTMFAEAARRMGYQAAVWDPDVQAPAHGVAVHSCTASFSDHAACEQFVRTVQAVTLEWENVPAELCEWLEGRCRVRPSSDALRMLQDRIEQKQFLASQALPIPTFAVVQSASQLTQAVNHLGLPAVCKTATSGYDGKGQWPIRELSDVARVEQTFATAKPGQRWILEQFVEFVRELSVLVVRNDRGEYRTYPVVENRHEHGILRETIVPAPISSDQAKRAQELSTQAVEALHGVGVFCVELFETKTGALLINEIAPRPHNSGHYTMDVCTVSQFEQQVRILCGLPLGETRLLSPAVMVNLIGDDVRPVLSKEGCHTFHAVSGAALHLYGKRVIRPGRKMGHVTFVHPQRETALEQAQQFVTRIHGPA
jgi:5-(carboxyamino)imidazole ribonucleotide synthase